MQRARRWRWTFLVFVACAAAPRKSDDAPPPAPEEAVTALFARAYTALSEGASDELAALFTDDALVFGPGPSETWHSGEVNQRVRQSMLPIGLTGVAVRVDESRVLVGVEADGRAAWASDLPRVTTTSQGRDEVWLPRITAHLLLVENGWRVDALHVSLAVPDETLSAPGAARRLLPPVDVPNQRPTDADQLVGLVRRALDDYAVKVERTSERPEFLQVGTSPTEIFPDGKSFKALIKPQLGAIKKANYSWKLDGNLAVKLSPGGRSGWAAAVVVQRAGKGSREQVFPPFRFLWTLSEEGGVWNITSEHQSLAVNPELREPATAAEREGWKAVKAVLKKVVSEGKPAPKPAPAAAPDAGVSVW